ncbi:hypothetical protein D3C81_1937580 [compost metagenome]
MPIRNAPTAPMPVQMVYAVPSGSVRIARASNQKLAIMPTRVMMLGTSRVKPWDCFIANAQTISSKPAINR